MDVQADLCICLHKVVYTWPQGYKTFFMLNSAEHEILNVHKCKNIKKFSLFQAQISLECYFSCTFMSRKIFHAQFSMQFFLQSQGLVLQVH